MPGTVALLQKQHTSSLLQNQITASSSNNVFIARKKAEVVSHAGQTIKKWIALEMSCLVDNEGMTEFHLTYAI